MTDTATILDADLDAYVDNQLDADGRLRVETYLARHPDVAARVMADLGMRTTLRLAVAADVVTGRPETREAARHLSAGLAGLRMWMAIRRVAAVALLVSAGWVAHSSFGPLAMREVNASVPPPAFVEQAVRAHQTALVRKGMPSQTQAKTYDREDIRAATAIVMPRTMDIGVMSRPVIAISTVKPAKATVRDVRRSASVVASDPRSACSLAPR